MANETLATLEDAVLTALAPLDATQPGGYLRTRKAYQGELDVETADQINLQWPAVLVFVSGIDYTPVSTRGLDFIEKPELTVFVGDLNWRGQHEARRGGTGAIEVGTYTMMRNVRDRLAGKTFGLPIGPLTPRDVRSVVQSAQPALSIYAMRFGFTDVEFNATGD